MHRSVSWLGCAVFTAPLVFSGCGGDNGADDSGHVEGGAGGKGGSSGATAGKGGSAGTGASGGSSGANDSGAGSGGEAGESGGSGGDAAGSAGSVAGGSAGEAGAGEALAGAGGDDAGPPACRAGRCCLEEVGVCVQIADGVEVAVTASMDVPDLGAGVALATAPVDVDFAGDSDETISVVATIDESVDPQVVVVVRTEADGRQTDVDATVEGGTVTFVAAGDGTYVVGVIDTTPPAGCAPNELEGTIQVRSDLEADLVNGVTRIEGDLAISAAVSNLEALRCLTHVTGNVTLSDTTALATLPLPYLAVAGGRVSVANAGLLTTLAFTRLRRVGATEMESIVLAALPALFSVDFRRLAHTPGSLVMSAIAQTPAEPLTLAFSKLASVGGDVNLSIASSASEAFAALRYVGGSVALSATGATLSGFSSLETIGGALSLSAPSVEVVRFDALRSVGSVETQDAWPLSLDVLGGLSLREVGFPSLASTPGSVYVAGGSSGTGLTLELGLEELGGSLSLELEAENTDLATLAALTHVQGDLRLRGRFPDVALPLLTSVGGALLLDSDTALSFSADALTTIGESLTLESSDALQAIELGALTSVNPNEQALSYTIDLRGLPGLMIVDLSSLEEIAGNVQLALFQSGSVHVDLSSLSQVRGDFIAEGIWGNRLDTSALSRVDGSILLWDNRVPLEFHALASIGGQISIQGGDTTHLDLSSLTSVGSSSALGPGSLMLEALPQLEHVDLSNLLSMSSHFHLVDVGGSTQNPLALDLAALISIGGDVEIAQTNNLSNADDFAGIDSIAGNLTITENDALTRLDGFNGLAEVGGNLTISRNGMLPTCLAEGLATHLDGVTFDGTVTINYNLSDSCD